MPLDCNAEEEKNWQNHISFSQNTSNWDWRVLFIECCEVRQPYFVKYCPATFKFVSSQKSHFSLGLLLKLSSVSSTIQKLRIIFTLK